MKERFQKLIAYSIPVFENIGNTILVFFENHSYILNLVFFKTKNVRNQTCFLCFLYSFCFLKQKRVFKNYKQT